MEVQTVRDYDTHWTQLRDVRRLQDHSAGLSERRNNIAAGESGTGKELVAKAILTASLRPNGPFLALYCAAVAETLLESELFGPEPGASTGSI